MGTVSRNLQRYPAESLVNALFDEAGDALFLVDGSSLVIIDVNPLACRLTGRRREELIDQPVADVLEVEEGADDWRGAAQRTTTFHGRPGFLLRTATPGGPVPVGLSLSRLHVGEAVLTLFVFRDMRQTHSLLRKLRRTEQELREVLLSLSDGIWAATNTGSGWHYLYLSPVVADLTGIPLTTLLEHADALLPRVHPDDRVAYLAYRAKLRQGEPAELEFRLIPTAESAVTWLRERVQVARTPTGYRLFGIVTDISEPRRLQEERQAMEQGLQEAQRLQALGVLAGGVAHDFNNLLTTVLGYAALLQDQLPVSHPGRQYAAAIQTAATRGATLTQHMLAYTGTGLVQPRWVQAEEIVREVIDRHRHGLPGAASPSLTVTGTLPTIHADPTQLRQVVNHLLTNAIESLSGSGGTVAVTLGRERLASADLPGLRQGELKAGDEYLVLEIRDTGTGMPSETLTRMFEPFFSTKFLGRGLGLAAVQGIVRTHGGAIAVESEAGRGTVVRVLLPLAKAPD